MMEAAETRRDGVLADILRSVPPTLWRLVIPTGSLLPAKEPLRSPGCAFVEPDGAHGALAQAMLTLVFRIVRRGDVPDSLVVPGVEISDGYRENRDGNREATGGGGQDEKPPGTRPWSTAAEALAATARASADAGADGDGDGNADAWMGFAGRLVRLFSDQDDALIDMLLQNLYIFHNTQPAVSASLSFVADLATTPLHPPDNPIRLKCMSALSRGLRLGVCVNARDGRMRCGQQRNGSTWAIYTHPHGAALSAGVREGGFTARSPLPPLIFLAA